MEESPLDVAFALILYCSLSPLLTWLNKFVLVVPFCSQTLSGGTFTVTFFQQLSTFLVFTAVKLSSSVGRVVKDNRSGNKQQLLTFCFGISEALQLAPAALCFVLQLVMCNASLRAIPLSSYQAARSSSLIFGIVVNRFILHEPISGAAIASTFIVGLGFVLSVFDPSQTTCFVSVFFGVNASLAGVFFMTLCRRKACERVLTEMELARWIAFNASVFLLPFVAHEFICGNGSLLFSFNNSEGAVCAAFFATLFLAPLIPLCTATCLKHITPLGCTIVGFGKSCVCTVVGNWMFGDPLSFRSVAGVTLCLVGCCMYSISGKNQKKSPLTVSLKGSPESRRASISADFDVSHQETRRRSHTLAQTQQ